MKSPADKYLFKVTKITFEKCPGGRCSNVILLTLNRYLPTVGVIHRLWRSVILAKQGGFLQFLVFSFIQCQKGFTNTCSKSAKYVTSFQCVER